LLYSHKHSLVSSLLHIIGENSLIPHLPDDEFDQRDIAKDILTYMKKC